MYKILVFSVLVFISCDSLPFTQPSVEKECDFKLPIKLRVAKNKSDKWGIIDSVGDVLGYSRRYSFYDFYTTDYNNDKMLFDDSCSAKGLAKKYLEYLDKNKFK